jgi:hypothetical protein
MEAPLHKWMGSIEDTTPICKIVMPASHNAASYSIKNFIMIVKNYVACQDLTIYDQLRAGIRVLDLRIACFQPTKSSPI